MLQFNGSLDDQSATAKMANSATSAPFTLLYLDDSAEDQLLVREAFRLTGIPVRMQEVSTADQAVEWLQTHGIGCRRLLLLLDYQLIRETSIELLCRIRADRRFASLPIITYSGSDQEQVVLRCYRFGADGFLCKPVELARVKAIASALSRCMAFDPPCFEPLERCTEYRPWRSAAASGTPCADDNCGALIP